MEAGLSIDEIDTPDSSTTLFIGKKTSSTFSYGEYARVAVLRTSDHETTVRVLSKKRASFNVTARGDYSEQIFTLMTSLLAERAGGR